MNQKTGGDHPVRFDFLHIRRLHCFGGAAGVEGAGAAPPVGAVPVEPAPAPRGMTPRTFFRCRALTSSFVVVCGFNSTASFQAVSLPGAAPESTYPFLISRKASCRSLVRYSRTLGSMRGAASFCRM